MYDKIGRKSPKWDSFVKEGMDLGVRSLYDSDLTVEQVRKPIRAAIEAGCDDPMVEYLNARLLISLGEGDFQKAVDQLKASCRSIVQSKYPMFRAATALVRCGQIFLGSDLKDEKNPET